MNGIRNEFASLVDALRGGRVLTEVRGCSSADIAHLEQKFGCTVPLTYRLFLETMGRSSGRLLSHDHLDANYDDVLDLHEELAEAMSESSLPGAARFRLPDRGLVICGRLGEQFLYIVCDHAEDTPVFHVNTTDRMPRQVFPGVLAWLQDLKAEALEAVRSGYFDAYPDGTGS